MGVVKAALSDESLQLEVSVEVNVKVEAAAWSKS